MPANDVSGIATAHIAKEASETPLLIAGDVIAISGYLSYLRKLLADLALGVARRISAWKMVRR